jgi:hypothetical protein
MSDAVPVHRWTKAWWDTLPDQYKALDAFQEAPNALQQVGFNIDPLFRWGFDAWEVTAVEQSGDFLGIRMARTFSKLETYRNVNFRVWWANPDAGAEVTLRLTGPLAGVLVEETFTGFTEPIGMVEVNALVPNSASQSITAVLEVKVPTVLDDDQLFTITAVNVGYVPVAYDLLPGVGAPPMFPLLRWMNGIGAIAGEVRDLSDDMWAGKFTDPAEAPEYALRWLAQLMGVPKKQRDIEPAPLRDYLLDVVAQGRPATGNRQSIADAAKRFLTGDRQVSVVSSKTAAHTLVILCREDEVPGTLADVVAGVRSTGVVPAGHDLQAVYGAATWDEYEAALADDWAGADAQRPTWTAADSLGVALE